MAIKTMRPYVELARSELRPSDAKIRPESMQAYSIPILVPAHSFRVEDRCQDGWGYFAITPDGELRRPKAIWDRNRWPSAA